MISCKMYFEQCVNRGCERFRDIFIFIVIANKLHQVFSGPQSSVLCGASMETEDVVSGCVHNGEGVH